MSTFEVKKVRGHTGMRPLSWAAWNGVGYVSKISKISFTFKRRVSSLAENSAAIEREVSRKAQTTFSALPVL